MYTIHVVLLAPILCSVVFATAVLLGLVILFRFGQDYHGARAHEGAKGEGRRQLRLGSDPADKGGPPGARVL